eukprot:Plantae.Rhodophyta-Hildenbrandia_rubra.ctg1473.p1 GENE.Plantae.Rhodophyta-Hildenbrandia_rubra.ctg1473~~Plantae.Rhodophyta-Hildenbrandia_rubra.ctg1473.p1  ORF type:complete len:1860 (-),score=262.13 Plantae.Rhodophyta-Hildenbrandia_rubra.ctg1473:3960-9539(-)
MPSEDDTPLEQNQQLASDQSVDCNGVADKKHAGQGHRVEEGRQDDDCKPPCHTLQEDNLDGQVRKEASTAETDISQVKEDSTNLAVDDDSDSLHQEAEIEPVGNEVDETPGYIENADSGSERSREVGESENANAGSSDVPVVSGIESSDNLIVEGIQADEGNSSEEVSNDSVVSKEDSDVTDGSGANSSQKVEDAEEQLLPLKESELSSFVSVLKRFDKRMTDSASGRKHRLLLDAWKITLARATAHQDRAHLIGIADGLLTVFKEGCESQNVLIVDCCLDLILRLFEYQYLGTGADVGSGFVVLDSEQGRLDDIMALVCGCLEVKEEEVYLRMVQTLLTAASTTKIGLHAGTLLAAVRTIYNIFLNAKTRETRTTARVSLTQILNLVFARMEGESAEDDSKSFDTVGDTAENTGEPLTKTESVDESFSSILQKDAYLLFRALCKLSSKPIADNALLDSVPSRSKLLSLQLLYNILASSGPTFRSGTRFIYALRSYLAPSLLQNALSNHIPTISVALDTMELLLMRESLRAVLKDELGLMIPATLFRFVSSSHSGDRRAKALSVLNSIAADGQTLADIFLNYDCVHGAPSMFKLMMEVLASTTEGEAVRPDNRMKSLAAVVGVLKSLRTWIDTKQAFGDGNGVQDCEAVLERKGRQGEAVRLFNSKPKKGIQYLVEKGSLKRDASDVARWIASSRGLDKAMIGEYLGDGIQFNQDVLMHFVNAQNFKDLVFDEALRQFLVRFRLPGEAQKIDRFMQSFASRFCDCNPDVFAGPDTAHVLAYSCIMLHTDAHNDSIKVKMTAEDFKRNNRDIDNGKSLDPAFLRGLYDRITKTEIKMDAGNDGDDIATTETAFEEESAQLAETIKAEFSSRKKTIPQYEYVTAANLQHGKLMFVLAWPSVLSTLSIILERAPQGASKTISLCLSGFRQAIALTSSFRLSTQKHAFVSSLSRFMHLDSLSDLHAKNLECIRMVLAIAAIEGDALGEQWRLVIHAISQVERMRAIASDNPKKYALSKESSSHPETFVAEQNGKRLSVDSRPEGKQKETLQRKPNGANGISLTSSIVMNGTIPTGEKLQSQATSIAKSIPEANTERIFLSSKMLSSAGYTDFISALCAVSMSELTSKSGPTVFCVQKLVESVSYNCERRDNEAWSRSWITLTTFFKDILAMDVTPLSLYAVDIARQLAQKWLDFDEAITKNLQRAALRPFVPFFLNSKGRRNVSVREMVLQSLLQIALSKGSDLNEGWRPILAVLTSAATDKEEDIVVFGWQILERVARYNMSAKDDGLFLEAASTLTAYAQNASSSVIAIAAISHLCTKCPKLLADSLLDSEEKFSADIDSHVGAWFRILTGVAAAASDERPTVRTAAFDGLFAILMTYGGRFSPSLWHLVLRGVLSPLLDEVNAAEDNATASRWVSSSGASILRSFVEVFAHHRLTMRAILGDVTALLRKWITHEAELVAREGMAALSKLVKKCGADFCSEDWDIVVGELSSLFDLTMPYEILGPGRNTEHLNLDNEEVEPGGGDDESRQDSIESIHSKVQSAESESNNVKKSQNKGRPKEKADIQIVRSKCVVQLLLIQMVQDVVVKFYVSLSTEHMSTLACSVERSYQFAREFNADVERRFSLWRTGFMNQVPNLLKQETTGVMTFLRVLLWLYLDESREATAVEEKLFKYCEDVKTAFVEASENAREKPDEHREVDALFPVVIFILKGLMQMSERQFQHHIEGIYDLVLELMEASDVKEVRAVVRDLFEQRVAPFISSKMGPNGGVKTYTPRPQIPGDEREVVLALEGVELHEEETAVKVQAAIEKISGVSSAVINTEEGIARVYTTAPDELLVSTLTMGGKVKGASIYKMNDIDVLD